MHQSGSPDQLFSTGYYDNDLQKVICAYKFDGKVPLAVHLALRFVKSMEAFWNQQTISAIVTVPTTHTKQWQRGFNPVQGLALQWQSQLKIKNGTKIPIWSHLLRSPTDLKPQVGASKHNRKFRAKLQYRVKPNHTVNVEMKKGQNHVILIDDVLTTGSTLLACSRSLRQVWPNLHIHAVVLAHTRLHTERA